MKHCLILKHIGTIALTGAAVFLVSCKADWQPNKSDTDNNITDTTTTSTSTTSTSTTTTSSTTTTTLLSGIAYYVATNEPTASDTNDGLSLAQPFKTMGHAVQFLTPGDVLFIREGIYRETFFLAKDGTVGSPIVVQAYPGDEGDVIIRGSDIVTGWTNDGGNVWSAPWQPLPLIEFPDGYPGVTDYARRRELVIIDGNRYQQVLSSAELGSGNFWMDDVAQRMRIYFSGDLNARQVEMSTRTQGVHARGRNHLVIRGLRVEHFSTDIWISAMHLGNHAKIENCRVEYNNGHGISVEADSLIRDSVVNHNGRIGIDVSGSNSLFDSNVTDHNSWRYGDWASGGVKVVSTGAAANNHFIRHTARYNNGPGIWLDTVSDGNIIESSLLEGNVRSGIEIEAAIGPNWVINNVILNNTVDQPHSLGIRLLVSRGTHIYNNTIAVDGAHCIRINGTERVSGPYHVYAADTFVFNNILNSGTDARVIDLGVGGLSATDEMLDSHQFNNNLYYGGDPMIWWKGGFSLSDWQNIKGQDLDSHFGLPLFVNPGADNYSLQSSSLAVDAGQNLPEVTEDYTGANRPMGLGIDIGAFESH